VSPARLSQEKQVSRGIVAIYKRNLGRGPTSARTEITAHASVTTLANSLTLAENSLVNGGEESAVREIRRKFQEAMRDEIVNLVEGVTGRKVASFLSDHDTGPDVAVEMVVFSKE
jgi:uncharacterized protein YbcI